LEIRTKGLIESEEQVKELAEHYRGLIIPKEPEDLELTHWSLIRENGETPVVGGINASLLEQKFVWILIWNSFKKHKFASFGESY
jgi:hypothetical protein